MKQITTLLLLLLSTLTFAGCNEREGVEPYFFPFAELENTYWVQSEAYWGNTPADLVPFDGDGPTAAAIHFGENLTVTEYWLDPKNPQTKYYKNSNYTFNDKTHTIESNMLDFGTICDVEVIKNDEIDELRIIHRGTYAENPLRYIIFKQVERDTEWDNEWKDAIDFDATDKN